MDYSACYRPPCLRSLLNVSLFIFKKEKVIIRLARNKLHFTMFYAIKTSQRNHVSLTSSLIFKQRLMSELWNRISTSRHLEADTPTNVQVKTRKVINMSTCFIQFSSRVLKKGSCFEFTKAGGITRSGLRFQVKRKPACC